jgi:hypothetical protein
MSDWPGYSTDYIRRRFDRLAAIYPILDWLPLLPQGFATKRCAGWNYRAVATRLRSVAALGGTFPRFLRP